MINNAHLRGEDWISATQNPESTSQRLVRSVILVLIVNIIVAHVEIEHLIFFVVPSHGIVSAATDLALLWPGA